MKILKRTKGIDLKAKNPGLHGSVCIQFRDPTTGKVIDEEKHDNFFTDALKSVLNGCPFGLDKISLCGNGVNASDGNIRYGSMFEYLLGGIMLFPQSLGSDATELYAPFTNYPTAMASMQAFTARSNKQGTFNSVESSPLLNGGYRYVYDWNTSQGSGDIAAVALSHRYCYEYFNDGARMFYPYFTNESYNQAPGFYGNAKFGGANARIPITVGEKGVVTTLENATSGTNWCKCRFYKVTPFDFQLLSQLYLGIPEYQPDGVTRPLEFAWEADFTSEFRTGSGSKYLGMQFDNGTLYVWQKNSNGTADLTLITVDLDDGSVLTRQTLQFAAPDSSNSDYHFAIKNGYIYMPTTTGGKIYKCNLSNVSDVNEIACNAQAYDFCWASDGSDNIYGREYTINNDIANDMAFSTPNYNAGRNPYTTDDGRNIIYEKGVWIVSSTPTQGAIGAQIKTPYLATKNNLDETKTKTSDKTMKVIYTVTQV